jgi:hypothetical protein
LHYAAYGAPGSVFAMPLVWLGLFIGAPSLMPSHFLFSMMSPVFGAGVALILFLFYLELGVTRGEALAWTAVSSFATYIWSISASAFDNPQHTFFVIALVYFAYLGSRRKSWIYAVVAGLCAGILFLYQEYFVLVIPGLALATLQWPLQTNSITAVETAKPESAAGRVLWTVRRTFQAACAFIRTAWSRPGDARSSLMRYSLILAGMCVGIGLSLAYNHLRFGSWLYSGKMRPDSLQPRHLLGNPLIGFLTLLVSPGKSIFLYSPTVIFGILGIHQLWRRKPELVAAIGASTLILVLFLSCIVFAGGDWCWGPRYLTPLLPLWALAFPFMAGFTAKRYLVPAIVAAGALAQLLGLSVENNRFFLEEGLYPFFWVNDPWFYFKHSAFFARFGEAISLSKGVPPTAQLLSTIPVSKAASGNANLPRAIVSQWKDFKIYFLPRPWPLWMQAVPSALRPVDMGAWLVGLLSMTVLGGGLTYQGLKEGERQ